MSFHLRLPKFQYLGPSTAVEVCKLLASHPGEARLLAGGTDLILQMRRRDMTPRFVIGLKGIKELALIREEADGSLAIGGMTTIQTLLTSPLIRKKCSILSQTAAGM